MKRHTKPEIYRSVGAHNSRVEEMVRQLNDFYEEHGRMPSQKEFADLIRDQDAEAKELFYLTDE